MIGAAGCAAVGAVTGPFLAGLTRTVPSGAPVRAPGWWRGAPATPRRRVVVTGLTAGTCALVGRALDGAPALPAFLWLTGTGVALAVVDLDCHRLPDRIVYPAYPAGLALLGTASVISGDGWALVRAVTVMAVVLTAFAVLRAVNPAGLGAGDVKLAGPIGLHLGWLGVGPALTGLVLGFLAGGVAAAFALARRSGPLAFGPALLCGALAAVVTGWSVT